MTAIAPEAPATSPRPTASEARFRENVGLRPGWITVAAKEFADHIQSVRFYVLLIVVGFAALIPLYFAAERIRSLASEVSGSQAVVPGAVRRSVRKRDLRADQLHGPGVRRDRGAAARRGLRLRFRERRAPPGHAAEAALAADPPRRRHQRQVRGRPRRDRDRPRCDPPRDLRLRPAAAGNHSGARGGRAARRPGLSSRSCTSPSGWRSERSCPWSSAGLRRRRWSGSGSGCSWRSR